MATTMPSLFLGGGREQKGRRPVRRSGARAELKRRRAKFDRAQSRHRRRTGRSLLARHFCHELAKCTSRQAHWRRAPDRVGNANSFALGSLSGKNGPILGLFSNQGGRGALRRDEGQRGRKGVGRRGRLTPIDRWIGADRSLGFGEKISVAGVYPRRVVRIGEALITLLGRSVTR
jgi:hypothetical protein